VVTALRAESRSVLAALARPRRVTGARPPTWVGRAGSHCVTLVQVGIGSQAVRRALPLLPTTDVFVSVGFAGGLAPALVAGDLVVPTEIVWEEAGVLQRYAVPRGLRDGVERALALEWGKASAGGALFSSPIVVAGTSAKRSAAERHGAVAVDMEAAALAAHASEQGVALFALRAILDPADLSLERLPPGLETSWAARARLATMPSVWPLLATLWRCVGVAAAALTRSARAALPAVSTDSRG